jgi:hypothetical protein
MTHHPGKRKTLRPNKNKLKQEQITKIKLLKLIQPKKIDQRKKWPTASQTTKTISRPFGITKI